MRISPRSCANNPSWTSRVLLAFMDFSILVANYYEEYYFLKPLLPVGGGWLRRCEFIS